MALTKIGNTHLDLLNHHELKEGLTAHQHNWFAERARGVKTLQIPVSVASVVSNNVTIPAAGQTPIGPRPGFTWAVKRLTAGGLATNDVLNVYLNVVNDMNLVGVLTSAAPSLFPGELGIILQEGDVLVFHNPSSLAATGDIAVNGQVIEVPTTDVWKIVGA